MKRRKPPPANVAPPADGASLDPAYLRRRVRLHAARAAFESALLDALPLAGVVSSAFGHDPARAAQQRLHRELGLSPQPGAARPAAAALARLAGSGRQRLVHEAVRALAQASRGTHLGRLIGKRASPIVTATCAVLAGIDAYRRVSRQALDTLATPAPGR